MTTDEFLHLQRSERFSCVDFTCLVWERLTGENIAQKLAGLTHAALGERRPMRSHYRAFDRLSAPVDPCLVLCSIFGVDPHIGVYMRGKVFHLAEASPMLVSVECFTAGFTDIRYFK